MWEKKNVIIFKSMKIESHHNIAQILGENNKYKIKSKNSDSSFAKC